MNLKRRVLDKLAGRPVDKTPVGCTTSYGVIEVMKKCGAERPLADTDPEALSILAMAGYEHLGFEWIKAMGWDITVVSEVFGCALSEPTISMTCSVKSHPFTDCIDGISWPKDFDKRGRFPVYRRQFEILKEKVGDSLAIYGQCEGPLTVGGNLVGIENIMRSILTDVDKVKTIISAGTEAVIDCANFAERCGADYFNICEPTSGPALISPRMWEILVQPAMATIVENTDIPIVLHVCSNTDKIIPMMCDTGVAAISIEEAANMKRAVEIAHAKDVRVFGNVSTSRALFMGTPEECYQEASNALKDGVDFLTPGCGIPPGAPLENILQLRRARDDFYK
ncbi:MAG: methyltransferase [Desulfobacteraceae bacterium]|nr:methyltransferase [Desulfobacteraceae bacterium]